MVKAETCSIAWITSDSIMHYGQSTLLCTRRSTRIEPCVVNNDDGGTCTLRSRTEPRRAASRLIATTGGAQHPQSCGPADIEFDVHCLTASSRCRR